MKAREVSVTELDDETQMWLLGRADAAAAAARTLARRVERQALRLRERADELEARASALRLEIRGVR